MRETIRRAEIIAVGSELLTPFRIDTNSLFITERLNAIGIEVGAKTIVGDELGELTVRMRQALSRADLLVLTGGLGPTDDDVTRDAASRVFGRPLEEDATLVEGIRARFAARGLEMPEINRRQAMVPRGATLLENSRGTAPGLWMEEDGKFIVLLPGPPRELRPMMEAVARERLEPRAGGQRVYRRTLRVFGRSESHVDEAVQPIYSRWQNKPCPIATTILAVPGQIEICLTVPAASETEAQGVFDEMTAEVTAVMGMDLFSADDRTMEQIVAGLLTERRLRIAVGESCTGGLIASRLTDVPGSSAYFELSVVAYGNRAKTELLGVSEILLESHGAVSEPVARAMAVGARERGHADFGIGVTGIAGPSGGTDRKPVGTVAVAVVGPAGADRVRTFQFPGGREQIKFFASQAALDGVRRLLLGTRDEERGTGERFER